MKGVLDWWPLCWRWRLEARAAQVASLARIVAKQQGEIAELQVENWRLAAAAGEREVKRVEALRAGFFAAKESGPADLRRAGLLATESTENTKKGTRNE